MFLRTGLWILTLDVDGDCPPVEDVLCQLRVLAESAGRVKRGLTPGQEQTLEPSLPDKVKLFSKHYSLFNLQLY
jgi:hypothetical protein